MAWPGDRVQQMEIAKLSLRLSLNQFLTADIARRKPATKTTEKEKERERERQNEREREKKKKTTEIERESDTRPVLFRTTFLPVTAKIVSMLSPIQQQSECCQ